MTEILLFTLYHVDDRRQDFCKKHFCDIAMAVWRGQYDENPYQLLDKMKGSIPSAKQLKKRLQDKDDSWSALKYFLFEYEVWITIHVPNYHLRNLTLEHILPQTPSDDWKKRFSETDVETYTSNIGNVLLATTEENSSFSNNSWVKKRKQYQASNFASLEQVGQNFAWTVQHIDERKMTLIDFAIKRWSPSILSVGPKDLESRIQGKS